MLRKTVFRIVSEMISLPAETGEKGSVEIARGPREVRLIEIRNPGRASLFSGLFRRPRHA